MPSNALKPAAVESSTPQSRSNAERAASAWPLLLLLTATLGPLSVLAGNVDRLAPGGVLWSIAVLGSILLILRVVLVLTFHRPAMTDPLLAVITIGLLYNGLYARAVPLAVWLLGVVILAGLCLRPATARRLSAGLTVFLAVLVGPIGIGVARDPTLWERGAIRAELDAAMPPLDPTPALAATKDRPDVFYVVLDRYARADQLASVFSFDNEPFLRALEARGFHVTRASFGAYPRTAHSLMSTLNLAEVPEASKGSPSDDWVPIYERLSSPRLYPLLDQLGYEIRTYGSWWEPTRTSPFADRSDAYYAVPESLRPIVEGSWLAHALFRLGMDALDPRQRHCKRLNHGFSELAATPVSEQPIFAFAHFLVPHPPFVVDASGNCMSVEEASARSRRDNYIGQLEFANARIIAMVDALIARDPGAIIVLQSDEGPWPQRVAGEEVQNFGADISSVKWSELSPAELREKMAILNAVRLPEGRRTELAPAFSPVNTFRMIMRTQLGLDLPDLPNTHRVFSSDEDLYSFTDVQNILVGDKAP